MEREGKGQVTGVFGGSGGCRESAAAGADRRRRGGSAGAGGMRSAYGMGSRVAECRSGTPGLGGQVALREWLRGGSGAGVREVLEWP